MNFKIPIAGLLIGLLVACSETRNDPTVQLTPKHQQVRQSKPEIKQPVKTGAKKPTNPFDRASFPQDSCGDKLPNDPKTDIVNFYPVFIDYNEINLQIIKDKYCKDADKITRKYTGKEAILVASFISKESANQFKEFLGTKLDSLSLEIGEPTVIAVNSADDVKPKAAKIASQESVIKVAKLTPEQAAQLASTVGTGNDFVAGSVVVLPTNPPEGYKIVKFLVGSTSSDDFKSKRGYKQSFAGGYHITYANSEGYCFSVTGGFIHPSGDAPYTYPHGIKLSTPALGKVEIGYDVFDKGDEIRSIGFQDYFKILKENNEYDFRSPAQIVPGQDCKVMKLKDAVQVVRSLQFLNP